MVFSRAVMVVEILKRCQPQYSGVTRKRYLIRSVQERRSSIECLSIFKLHLRDVMGCRVLKVPNLDGTFSEEQFLVMLLSAQG